IDITAISKTAIVSFIRESKEKKYVIELHNNTPILVRIGVYDPNSELFICDIDGKHLAISDFNEQKINIYSDSYGNNVGIGNFSGLRMHLSLGISKIEGV